MKGGGPPTGIQEGHPDWALPQGEANSKSTPAVTHRFIQTMASTLPGNPSH